MCVGVGCLDSKPQPQFGLDSEFIHRAFKVFVQFTFPQFLAACTRLPKAPPSANDTEHLPLCWSHHVGGVWGCVRSSLHPQTRAAAPIFTLTLKDGSSPCHSGGNRRGEV